MKNLSMLFVVVLCGAGTSTLSLADGTPTPIISQLPMIACAKPLDEAHRDFRNFTDESLRIASHFVSDQVNALKKLKKNLRGESRAIRTYMGWDPSGAGLTAYLALGLAKAKTAFDDTAYSGGSYGHWTNWTETMEFGQPGIYRGGYAVTACSETAFAGSFGRKLKMCSMLDIVSGEIWGTTLKEALQLGGNNIDENEGVRELIKAKYPMCLEAAGYTQPAPAVTASESHDAKTVEVAGAPAGDTASGNLLPAVIAQ